MIVLQRASGYTNAMKYFITFISILVLPGFESAHADHEDGRSPIGRFFHELVDGYQLLLPQSVREGIPYFLMALVAVIVLGLMIRAARQRDGDDDE